MLDLTTPIGKQVVSAAWPGVPWWRERRWELRGRCAGYQFNVTFLRYFLAPIFEVHEVKQAGPHEMVLKWCAHPCTHAPMHQHHAALKNYLAHPYPKCIRCWPLHPCMHEGGLRPGALYGPLMWAV